MFWPGSSGSLVAELLWVAPDALPLVGETSGGPGVVGLRDSPHDGRYGEPQVPAGGGVLQLVEGGAGPDERKNRALPLRHDGVGPSGKWPSPILYPGNPANLLSG